MFTNLFAAAVDVATSPIKTVATAADILDGLTEGEFRTDAAIKLGIDVSGMELAEIARALHENTSS